VTWLHNIHLRKISYGRPTFIHRFCIVFLDLLGFGLILPLLPFYAATFGAGAFVTGLLVASYAAAQLVGAPLLGRLSDRYGRRPLLLLSLLGTFVGFVLLGVARTLTLLFIARVLDGLTGGNISVAQAYITDVTDAKNRARGLGLIGAAFGLGFIIGPAAGAFLSRLGSGLTVIEGPLAGLTWRFALPAFVAAALALFNLVAVYRWLPESLDAVRRAASASPGRPEFSLRALRAAFARPAVGPLLHTRFWFALAFSTFQTIFPLYAAYRFGLNEVSTGYILTYVGILVVLVQGVGIRYLTAWFPERRLIVAAILLMAPSLLAWALAPTVPLLLVVLIPIALAGGTLNTVINSVLSKSVLPQETGGILGLAAALESLTRVVGPTLGGALLQTLGPWAPGVFGAVVLAWLGSFVGRRVLSESSSLASATETVV
jgi:DHA1 family tetracycline resistance protein-like MFS transporter